jgi:hypothetical protein
MALCYVFALKHGYSEYRRGWTEAKTIYYYDLRQEKMEEAREIEEFKRAQFAELDKENSSHIPISSDLLMAYGVATIGGLPKSVREAYNISDDMNQLDIETLIQIEETNKEV